MGKIVKKIAMGVLALTCTFGCVGTFTACDEGNPEAQIVLEFDGKEYALNYQLYKDRTPKTVNHFIWLAENNYYDGLCVHNYQSASNRWYTGAYSVDDNGNLDYKDYYTFVQTVKGFTHSVWRDTEKDDPLFTLYGEFKANGFNVGQNNRDALKQQYGSLSMYYHAKDEESGKVYVQSPDGSETPIKKNYSENSTTSMFYISTLEKTTSDEAHCTFATLNNKDVLEDLQEAIADYIGEEEDDWFVTSTTVIKDPYDMIVGKQQLEVTYKVPNEPITIKSVRITKY